MIEDFFRSLKKCIERYSNELKSGELLLPEYLEGKRFTTAFHPVVEKAANELGLQIKTEITNPMPEGYECGTRQVVDYVIYKDNVPFIFLEQESLDRAQLYLFRDHDDMKEEDNDNKLWYYYGTIVNRLLGIDPTNNKVKYFVFLLILPDQLVNSKAYTLWDIKNYYKFYHPSMKELVCQNPYRFYDHLIKTSARLFLAESRELPNSDFKSIKVLQDECELVFITFTGKKLILSRGKDDFNPSNEIKIEIDWG